MLVKTEALVLHSFRYGETRLVIDLFTREQGRLSVMATLPSSSRGRLKKQYFQPLTLLQAEVDHRASAQLQKLHDCQLLAPYTSLYIEPSKLSIALFLGEFLYHALKGEQQNVLLFDYLRSSFQWLDGCASGYANFHLVFLTRLSRFLGFYPNLEHYEAGCYFDLRESHFCAVPPLHRDFLRPDEASRLRLLVRMNYETMHLFRMSHTERNRCLDVQLGYYRLHLPAFPELRSLEVLKELWAQPREGGAGGK